MPYMLTASGMAWDVSSRGYHGLLLPGVQARRVSGGQKACIMWRTDRLCCGGHAMMAHNSAAVLWHEQRGAVFMLAAGVPRWRLRAIDIAPGQYEHRYGRENAGFMPMSGLDSVTRASPASMARQRRRHQEGTVPTCLPGSEARVPFHSCVCQTWRSQTTNSASCNLSA